MTNPRRPFTIVVLTTLAIANAAMASKVETWRHDSVAAFNRGKKERVVIAESGRVSLGRKIAALGTLDASHVWDLARDKKGVLYAATGSAGKVFRRDGDGPWTVLHDSDDSQVLSIAVMPDGRVFAGTGPSGKVVEVSDPKAPSSQPDPEVKYIWDLAADGDGNLYAATGPTGQLWKRDGAGKWSLLLDSKHPHLLCVAVGGDGSIYAGSDGEGLIYKVAPGGKISVVYDAPQNEVRALHVAANGILYAGTAAEAGGGGGGGPPRAFGGGLPAGDGPGAPGPGGATAAPPGGTVAVRAGAPGENAVYRIGPDGAAREIFRARAMIYALASSGDKILIGTGPEGLIHEVRADAREFAPLARVDHGQVLALVQGDAGDIFLAEGDPGEVAKLEPGYVAGGTLTSDVHDAKFVARYGAIVWKGDRPEGTVIAIQVRTGNVGEPDLTWSEWSAPQTDPGASRADVPPGRFVQYRATLKTDRPSATPELRSVAILYQTANFAPEIARVIVPDVTAGDGAVKAARLALRWDVTDPNDDEMTYSLQIRKDGWPDWVTITENPIAEKTYNWDASSVPGGLYRIKVTASDRPSNPPSSALASELASEAFVIDHLAPVVTITVADQTAKVAIKDDLTRIAKAAYSLDGGEWVAIFPDDGIFDTTKETIAIALKSLKAGTHVLTVRATDASGNVGAGDALFVVP